MKQQFSSFFGAIEEKDKKKIMKNGTLIFDANILLSLYSMENSEDMEEFFKIIEDSQIKKRIWLPYKIVEEFVSKKDKESGFVNSFENDIKEMNGFLKKILDFSKSKYDRAIQIENYNFDELSKFEKQIEEHKLEELIKTIECLINNKKHLNDAKNIKNTVFDRLGNIFNNKIGENFNLYELKKIYSEGEIRNSLKIPPGHRDDNKPYNKFGDLIIWKQIIEYSKKTIKI